MSDGPNYAAECAMRCAEPRFWHFLRDATKQPVDSPEEAAEAARVLCKVQSRRELNDDPGAADRWKRAKRLFQLWKDGVGKNAAGNLHAPSIMGRVAYSRGTLISENPFPRPEIDQDDETDFDLWEAGWRKAERNSQT